MNFKNNMLSNRIKPGAMMERVENKFLDYDGWKPMKWRCPSCGKIITTTKLDDIICSNCDHLIVSDLKITTEGYLSFMVEK